MFILTGIYHESAPGKREEFRECLHRKLESIWIEEIHLFIEEPVEETQLLAKNPLLSDLVPPDYAGQSCHIPTPFCRC
jgi:hypothetical protein